MHILSIKKTASHPISRAACLVCGLLLFLTPFSRASAAQLYATEGVNLREKPNASSQILAVLDGGSPVEVTGSEGNWIAVSAEGVSGYIYKDYLSESQPSAEEILAAESASETASEETVSAETTAENVTYVNSDEVNLRKKASSHCKIKDVLYTGDSVTILSNNGNWTKVRTAEGKTGYIYSIYLGEKEEASAVTVPSREDAVAGWKSAAIAYAQGHLGDTYSQEKRDDAGYADCSSLVRDAFLTASGVFIGNTTWSQHETMSAYFYEISNIYDLTPGDLVYHLSSDSHVGIYLGNGQVLQASQSAGTVKISSYDAKNTYWEYGCRAADFCYDSLYGGLTQ